MTIRVRKNDDSVEPVIYKQVEEVIDVFNDNGVYCKQVCMKDGSTATFPACEWTLYQLKWDRI